MPYRVIQWSTGNVGRYALRGIIGHPGLELAGVWVSSEAKAGRDAGELAGVDPVGVAATNDADALLASDADCVVYTATADLRPKDALDDVCRILRAGKNVVSSSIVPLIYPPAVDPAFTEPLEEACRDGKATFFTSGIDPGFANDVLPILLTGVCERIDSVRMQEILDYATYDQPTVIFDTMGFGTPLDHTPILLAPGVLTFAWGPVVHAMAAALGATLDDVRETYEKRAAEKEFDVLGRRVEAGTMAGLRFEVRGLVGGEARIVVEHVTRLHPAVAPDWPQPTGKGGYTVLIEGSPRIRCDLQMEGDGGDENSGGLIVTAMRLVNAIPAVCGAPPGMLAAADLPLIAGRGLLS